MNCCRSCKFWTGDQPPPPNQLYECNRFAANPPHANLDWGFCNAAPQGFDREPEIGEWSDYKMAVWDGSNYAASLSTRHDHICGEFKPSSAP